MSVSAFIRNHLCVLIALLVFLIIIIMSWKYLFVAILALTLAVVLIPIHRKFIRKIPAPLSSAIITTAVFVLVVGLCAFIAVIFSGNWYYLTDMIQRIIVWIADIFQIPMHGNSFFSDMSTGILSTLMEMMKNISPEVIFSTVSDAVSIVFGFVLLYAMLYLFIISGDRLWADIWDIIPEKSKHGIGMMAVRTKKILYSLYGVHVFLALLVFILALPYGWILSLAGVIPGTIDSIVFLALFCGIAALIPMIGAVFVIVFMSIYSLAIGSIAGVLISVFVGYFLLSFLIDFILRPKMTAKLVKIRPMLIFIGFFGGGAIMGVIGFVMGPIFLVLGITAYEIFFEEMRKAKELEMADNIPDQKLV
ncbi:MAG TPA: AI-2E family transporter [Methanocorpusculum sp.]|nr:AI-2E family transporter [Methanocorpusculum sp.]HJJ39776.1 AI-2E family transporter [Methanocorpusculum sp.]HJJ49386.1 AI-2E family transporter [Methanocorpusculum sp.]HJJ56570.1 AI-2E family transporter [Methanocorpusculum sp.]